jgi:glycosyltransferase involved in cell wall biosynthesis
MKIAIFTNNYLPNPFGVSMSIESFRKELEKAGHTVYVFAPEFKGYKDENPNVFRYPSVDLNFKNIRFPLAIPFSFKMKKILEKLEIDVIHAQHPNLLGWEAKKWAKKKGVPLIFTWHTLYDKYAHFTPLIPTVIAAKWAIGNAVKFANNADCIVTPTNSVKEIIRQWGVKNKNVIAIPTGIDESLFENADGKQIRLKYAIGDDEILLVLVTRFTKEKNVEFLFRSVDKAIRANSKIKFLACGEGDLTERLKTFIRKQALEDRIMFAGFVPNDVKKNFYAAGDIFVFASTSETQGMIVSEAMFMGLPVVAVKATGTSDLVANQISGLLVEEDEEKFANAIVKLANDVKLRKTLSQNALQFAHENYTSVVCTNKLLEVYRKAIEKRK